MQSGQKARWHWEHTRKASHSSTPFGFVVRNVAMASALRRCLFSSMMSVVLFFGLVESSANRQQSEPQAAQHSGPEASFVYGLPTKNSFAYSAMLAGSPGVGDGSDGNITPGLWIRRQLRGGGALPEGCRPGWRWRPRWSCLPSECRSGRGFEHEKFVTTTGAIGARAVSETKTFVLRKTAKK